MGMSNNGYGEGYSCCSERAMVMERREMIMGKYVWGLD
jgi:hypothetical protein